LRAERIICPIPLDNPPRRYEMYSLHRRALLLVTGVAVLAGTAVATTVTAGATATTNCGITWGSLPREAGGMSPVALMTTRTGQHPCYDRLVFELDGPANSYRVEYASEVYTEGEGAPLSGVTGGGALLRVSLRSPAYDIQTGRLTYLHYVGEHVAAVGGYQTLRDVVYGGTFEGYTILAVGTRARLPFRVFALSGPGAHSRIVLDIAHRW